VVSLAQVWKDFKPIVLVSASPRRQQLLKQIGVPFEVCPAEVDETLSDRIDDPETFAIDLALRKIRAVAKEFPDRWLLAADTLVMFGNEPLGKPQTCEEAASMLRKLSGRKHKVVTGLCLAKTDRKGRIRHCFKSAETTFVIFRHLTEEEIAAYIATGEPMDKAGAYGIQEKAAIFATRILGCYYNVVGLPLAKLAMMFREAGIEVAEFWQSPCDEIHETNRTGTPLSAR
jgi:septum formation protein